MKKASKLTLLGLLSPALLMAQTVTPWTEQNGTLGLGYPVPIPVDTPNLLMVSELTMACLPSTSPWPLKMNTSPATSSAKPTTVGTFGLMYSATPMTPPSSASKKAP